MSNANDNALKKNALFTTLVAYWCGAKFVASKSIKKLFDVPSEYLPGIWNKLEYKHYSTLIVTAALNCFMVEDKVSSTNFASIVWLIFFFFFRSVWKFYYSLHAPLLFCRIFKYHRFLCSLTLFDHCFCFVFNRMLW